MNAFFTKQVPQTTTFFNERWFQPVPQVTKCQAALVLMKALALQLALTGTFFPSGNQAVDVWRVFSDIFCFSPCKPTVKPQWYLCVVLLCLSPLLLLTSSEQRMSPQAVFQSGPGGKLPIAPSGQIAVSVLCVRTDSSTYCVIDVIFAFRHWLDFYGNLVYCLFIAVCLYKERTYIIQPRRYQLKSHKSSKDKVWVLTMMILHHIIDWNLFDQ